MTLYEKYSRGGNIAPLGHLYMEGEIDAFGIRAIMPWMSNRRFLIFDMRWRVFGGSWALTRDWRAAHPNAGIDCWGAMQ